MKRIIITLIAAMPMAAFAGTESSDTTFVLGNKQIIVSDSAGKTKVRINTCNGEKLTRTYETEYIDNQEVKRIYVTSPFFPESFIKKKRNPRTYTHYPTLLFGTNMLGGNIMSPGGSTAMHSRDSKSWEWALTVAQMAFNTGSNTSVNLSMNIGQVHNHFQGNYVLATEDGKTFMREIEDGEVKKSYISYTTIRVPIIFEWQRYRLFAGIGASLEYRTNDYARYFIGKKKYTSSRDINIAPLGINMEAYIGVGAFVIYGRAGITPLLKKSNAPECYTFATGIGFTI
ncbi:hypothetical protein [Xylanibacter muris]|uniref:Outer membrane protein beta-barrel domain-containing protein n=1 Tax=Xylanibacter muris TaxID=2736290 RepID=A0ABX2ANU5_9BACT|nr:hypothetical protein [Xylanibacter muris]NPD92903.1 hypothetical protein [Xylanibacter muris]